MLFSEHSIWLMFSGIVCKSVGGSLISEESFLNVYQLLVLTTLFRKIVVGL